jgi:hypothetical protein
MLIGVAVVRWRPHLIGSPAIEGGERTKSRYP